MKIALAQISMSSSISDNLNKAETYIKKAAGSNLIFFPEIQLSPFFPQYEKKNVDVYCMTEKSYEVQLFTKLAKKQHMYISPNLYMNYHGHRFDTSLWISPEGGIVDAAKMVHIAQAPQFYEQDYYTPSDDGFKVFDTEFGKIGIVICYDRHLPESIRTCVLKGAELIIIPTANTISEPMEMFEWEIRVQAMQNQVFIAMCNRVGTEDQMTFSGESLVVGPKGDIIVKADASEQLLICDVCLEDASALRKKVPYIASRRPQWYA